jgi:hypothetical protein
MRLSILSLTRYPIAELSKSIMRGIRLSGAPLSIFRAPRYRFLRPGHVLCAALLWVSIAASAQTVTPVPQLPNMTSVGVEGITVTASTAASPLVIQLCYQLACAPSQTAPKLPLDVSCASATTCGLLGGDPAYGEIKTLFVQQQAKTFTVSYTTATGTGVITVPALVVTPPVTPPASGHTIQCTALNVPQPPVIGVVYPATCVYLQ